MKLEWINEIETRLTALENSATTPVALSTLEPLELPKPFDPSPLEARLEQLESFDVDALKSELSDLRKMLEDIKQNLAHYIPQSYPYNDSAILKRLEQLEGGQNGSN